MKQRHPSKIPTSVICRLLSSAEILDYAKGDIITSRSAHQQYIWFVRKGIVTVHYIDMEDNENTLIFFAPGEMFLNSFHSKIYPNYSVEFKVESAAVLYRISYEKCAELMAASPEICYFLIDNFSEIMHRFMLLSLLLKIRSPDIKYSLFVRERSVLLRHLPLKDISRQIGITPETLSRVRNRQK